MSELNERSQEDIEKISREMGGDNAAQDSAQSASGEYIPNPDEPLENKPSSDEQLAGAMAMFVQIGTAFLASRMGAHWAASEDEALMMGKAYAEAMEYYYPDAEVGPGVAAVMVTGMYALPRMAMQKAAAKEAQKKREEGASSGDQSEQ